MARVAKLSSFFLLLLFLAPLARAQFIAIGGGVSFPQDRSAALAAGRIGGPAQADFASSGIFAVDAGVGFFPFLTAGLHYRGEEGSTPDLCSSRFQPPTGGNGASGKYTARFRAPRGN